MIQIRLLSIYYQFFQPFEWISVSVCLTKSGHTSVSLHGTPVSQNNNNNNISKAPFPDSPKALFTGLKIQIYNKTLKKEAKKS